MEPKKEPSNPLLLSHEHFSVVHVDSGCVCVYTEIQMIVDAGGMKCVSVLVFFFP